MKDGISQLLFGPFLFGPFLRGRRKARARGTALVEAAVVLPTLVMFLGCAVFIHRSYSVKIDKQMGTRAGVMYYASHSCEGKIPQDVVPVLDYANPGNNRVPTDIDTSKLGPSAPIVRAGIQRSWNLARAKPEPTVVSGSAVRDGATVALTRNVSAASEVACNEKAYPGQVKAMVNFMAEFAKSGGGFLD